MRIFSKCTFLFVGTDRPCRLGEEQWGNPALFSGVSGFKFNRGGSVYRNKYLLIFLNRPKKILGETESRT